MRVRLMYRMLFNSLRTKPYKQSCLCVSGVLDSCLPEFTKVMPFTSTALCQGQKSQGRTSQTKGKKQSAWLDQCVKYLTCFLET